MWATQAVIHPVKAIKKNLQRLPTSGPAYELLDRAKHGDPQSNSSWDNGPKKSEFRTVLSPNQSPYGDLDQTFPSSLETNRGTLRQRPDLKWPSLSGWQGGVAASAATVVLVLLVNVGIVIWVSLHFPINAGIATLLQGDCRRSKRWALWLHLFINALSTMLLAVSNYTMQCLHAPTRREVDRAHKQGKWLAIGLPSLRNITSVSWKRSALFLLLTMSSVPLHLMFNSVIFETLSVHDYTVYVVSERFINQDTYDIEISDRWGASRGRQQLRDTSIADMQNNTTQLKHLSPSECIKAYSSQLISDRGSLLAVTNVTVDVGNSVSAFHHVEAFPVQSVSPNPDSRAWICSNVPGFDPITGICNFQLAEADSSTWTVFDKPIEYCLSKEMEPHCSLEFSQTIMIVVICCNVMKAVCMALTVFLNKDTLVTVGDAAASFLEHPDPTTKDHCLLSRKDIKTGKWKAASNISSKNPPLSKAFEQDRNIWLRAPSRGRWLMTVILCAIALVTCGILLGRAINVAKRTGAASLTSLWNMGFGAVNPGSIIYFLNGLNKANPANQPLLAMVFLANTPQIILSILYFMYNALYTAMLSEDEWQRFSRQRKPLRVTSPAGAQRSTYFLSLPYTYAVPLCVFSALLHWLISQAIFLTRVYVYGDQDNMLEYENVTTCGWSSIAIIFVIICGVLMLVTAFAMGFRRLRGSMPLAGGCSAIISAACHSSEIEEYPGLKSLKWGALEPEREMGHCVLSSKDVFTPVPGQLYAGMS